MGKHTGVVTVADWHHTGFVDGRNGSQSWPPTGTGSVNSRTAYREGYSKGNAELRAFPAAISKATGGDR